MSQASLKAVNNPERRYFIGGSDARIIMGEDEGALLRLWREKRGEVEPEDLSSNLIVQLGVVTEHLNRHWYERNSGQVQKQSQWDFLPFARLVFQRQHSPMQKQELRLSL